MSKVMIISYLIDGVKTVCKTYLRELYIETKFIHYMKINEILKILSIIEQAKETENDSQDSLDRR